MKFKWKKLAAVGTAMALCLSAVSVPVNAMDAYVYVKSIALNKKAVTLYVGASESKSSVKLKATVKPSIVKATWISTNKKVASVSQKGLVKAKKAGKTTIIAKAASRQARCKVTVKKIVRKVKKITAANKTITVNKGKTKKLNITVLPKNATLKTVTYKSANKKIATVSQAGKVKGVKVGSTKITVSAVDGSKRKLTIKVKVVDGSAAEPTDEPTTEPTAEPTGEPTTEPTAEPTMEPTTEPTTEPTAKPPFSQGFPVDPTPVPDGTPSPEPFTTPVEGEKDEDGNTTFELDEETDYLIKAVVDGEEVELVTNDGTFSSVDSILKRLDTDKTIEEICDAFYKKGTMGGVFTYTPAAGVAVSVVKDADSNQAKLDISGISGGMSGKYDFTMTESDGVCTISGQKDADNYFGADVQKNADGSYTLSNIAGVQDGKPMGLLALLGSDAKVNASSGAGGSSLSILTGGEQILLSIGEDGNVSMKLPEAYMEKYQIEIFK